MKKGKATRKRTQQLNILGVVTFGRFQTAQQLPTTRNNLQQLATAGFANGRTYNIQQCWELLASNVASVCRGLRATEHSPVPCVLIGIFPVPDKYYVLMVNLFLPIFTLDKWHFTSLLRLLLLFWRIKWWLPLKKKTLYSEKNCDYRITI